MYFWIIAPIALIIGGYLAWVYFDDYTAPIWKPIFALCLIMFSIIVLITNVVMVAEYKEFEVHFEEQRAIYETIEIEKFDGFIVMTDILEANKELSEYKAEKKIYGNWTVVPESVLDISPIGMPVG